MSLKSRIDRLESQSGSGFCIVLNTELDADGQPFEASPPPERVWSARFYCARGTVTIARDEDESRSDFGRRAEQAARDHFPGALVLMLGAEWV